MTQPDVPIEDQPVEGSFNPDDYDWRTHVKTALDDLRVKVPEIDLDWEYYDGRHPKFWLTDTLADMFDHELAENMSENWCEVAVEAPVKRLGVTGWVSKTKNTIQIKAAENVFKENDFELEQKELYRQVRAVGESFVFVWKDDDKEFGIDATVNDARNVWWPPNAKRNDPDRVVKIWMAEDEGIWRATVYYRYVVVRLIGPKINQAKSMPEVRWFTVDEDDPGGEHGFEKVPVVRFAMQRRRKGVIGSVRKGQDKINKLVAGKMVTAEFNAWAKTILLTQQEIEDGDLKIRPDRFLKLHPGGGEDSAPTSVWESSPSELANFDDSIGKEIDKLFTMAGLPGHMQVRSTREVPSGAAYEADEGPFTEMINDMSKMFTASWVDFLEMCDIEDVVPQWKNAHVRSDMDEATTVKTFKEAGVPITLALRKYAGWDDEEIEELEDQPLSPEEQQKAAMAQMIAGVDGDLNADPAQGNEPPTNNAGPSGRSAQPTPPGLGK